jgi:acyl-coenzyme A thioesterase PaaI-like protein
VIGAIADSAAGYAALSLMPLGSEVLTVEYKLNLLAPAEGDLLLARGRVLRAGRTLSVCEATVAVVRRREETPAAIMLATLIRRG